MLPDSSASSSSFVVVPSVVFPILCSHASRAAPLRRCCRPCGMAFPQRNNKKCPSPPFQETETLKLLPSDSCSPCAKHFLTATNLVFDCISYFTGNRPRLQQKIPPPQGEKTARFLVRCDGAGAAHDSQRMGKDRNAGWTNFSLSNKIHKNSVKTIEKL